MSDLALAERHRSDQLRIRAEFLRTFAQIFRILSLGALSSTLAPFLDRAEAAVREAHDRSADASLAYYREARAASIAQRLKAEADRFAAQGPRYEPTRAEFSSERTRRSLTVATVGTATRAKRSGLVDLDDRAQVAAARSAGRLVLAGGRESLEDAIVNDPEAVGWARITDGNPCGFCAALASRGFVYLSRETALFDGEGEPYHDGDGCTTMPRFRDDTSPLPRLNQHLQDLWYETGAYFTGNDALNAFRRAVEAQRAGRDVRAAVFDGPKSDPDRYRRQVTHDEATVAQFRREAQRGGTNGLPPDDPRRELAAR